MSLSREAPQVNDALKQLYPSNRAGSDKDGTITTLPTHSSVVEELLVDGTSRREITTSDLLAVRRLGGMNNFERSMQVRTIDQSGIRAGDSS